MLEAMVDVIMHERPFCRVHRFFDGMQLLGDIQAGAACFHHLHDVAQMALCTLEPFQDFRMGLMDKRFLHNE